MIPIWKVIWHEWRAADGTARINEPCETMDDSEQVSSYVKAYEWGGPSSSLQLHHLRELSTLIRPGDTVLDLACGPGPLLLELAELYPDTDFIGADLSETMLAHLRMEVLRRDLRNVTVLQEDIRTLPSLADGRVDLVITTSALHHLPDEDSLRQVFRRITTVLKPGGGFYIFDFGLLKSQEARDIFVREVGKLAPALTLRDYEASLRAAFPMERVLSLAREELSQPIRALGSAFVDFSYFLQTPPRSLPSSRVQSRIREVWHSLPLAIKFEHLMLRYLRFPRMAAQELSSAGNRILVQSAGASEPAARIGSCTVQEF
ncbi:MAG: hypothetical protein C0404_01255 [Verrucomicrobia bacterium]|nr:hypothetical protein [Verrucomicrobiota bacterium]